LKVILKALIVLWMVMSTVSLAGLIYLLPSRVIVGAFAQVLKTPQNPDLLRWFYGCTISFVVSIIITIWLWRTYRGQYGKLWRSD
jgi:chromate transport protein ChrA